ncbi:MAG: hypothetical protein AB8B56_16830 [Crocinitomicaceae bacterium]
MLLYYAGVGLLLLELIAYGILFVLSIGILLSAWSSEEKLNRPFYLGAFISIVIAVIFYLSPNPKIALIGALTILSFIGVVLGKQAVSAREKFISYCICSITVFDGIFCLIYLVAAS